MEILKCTDCGAQIQGTKALVEHVKKAHSANEPIAEGTEDNVNPESAVTDGDTEGDTAETFDKSELLDAHEELSKGAEDTSDEALNKGGEKKKEEYNGDGMRYANGMYYDKAGTAYSKKGKDYYDMKGKKYNMSKANEDNDDEEDETSKSVDGAIDDVLSDSEIEETVDVSPVVEALVKATRDLTSIPIGVAVDQHKEVKEYYGLFAKSLHALHTQVESLTETLAEWGNTPGSVAPRSIPGSGNVQGRFDDGGVGDGFAKAEGDFVNKLMQKGYSKELIGQQMVELAEAGTIDYQEVLTWDGPNRTIKNMTAQKVMKALEV